MASGHILLVDDEPGMREAVQAYLEDTGFTVEAASNAEEGWEKLQQFTPDLVVSDVMMPRVDGYQFLAQMRGDDRFKALPVIFLTAKGMTTDRIQGFDAGCDAYLPKPFDPDELVSVVTNLLKRRAVTVDAARGGSGGASGSSDNPEIADLARQIEELRRAVLGQRSGNGIIQKPSPIQIDLTPREKSVLDLVAQGLMNKEIAKQLETSVRNVEKYVSRLFSKTGTNSRTELVRFALEHGLTT